MVNRTIVIASALLLMFLIGCNPPPALHANASTPKYQTDGAVAVWGNNFTPSTQYDIEIYPNNGQGRFIGHVTTDSSGNIPSTVMEYQCLAQNYSNVLLNVAAMTDDNGTPSHTIATTTYYYKCW